MTTQRRVGGFPAFGRTARPEVGTAIFVLRFLVGTVVPAAILLAVGLAVSHGEVLIEEGRRIGPFNFHRLRGMGCVLFGLFGLLLSLGIGLRGWAIGCESDECRDMAHLGVIFASVAALLGAVLADAFLRGG